MRPCVDTSSWRTQTLGDEELTAKLAECMDAGPSRFYLVVPVTNTEGSDRWFTGGLEGVLPGAYKIARTLAAARLQHELDRLREAGAEADGEVVEPMPLDAVRKIASREETEEVIVSTLPRRLSRWIALDSPTGSGGPPPSSSPTSPAQPDPRSDAGHQFAGVEVRDTSSPAATRAEPITVAARGPRRRAEPGWGGGGRMSATPRATRGSRKAAATARCSHSSRSSSRPLATVSTRPWRPISTPAGRLRRRRSTHSRPPTRASTPAPPRRNAGHGTRWHQTAYVSPEREPHCSSHRILNADVMPLASTLLVLLKRGATCRSPSSSKDRPATSIRQGLTRSPTSVAALVRNSLENLVLLGQMRSIRGYYRGLVPEAGEFFDPPEANVVYQAAVETIGLRASPGQALFTGASVVAAINSILGGAGLALLAGRLGHLGDGAALTVGGAAAVLVFGLHLGYQQQRVADLRRRS